MLAANEVFYKALAARDLEQMEAVWWHEDWVICLHPGWDLILGWENVYQSWATMFGSLEEIGVTVSRPLVRVFGDAAWVSCVEHVTSTFEDGFSTMLVEATNIFIRRQGRWRMVHHHTTLLPERPSSGMSQRVQ